MKTVLVKGLLLYATTTLIIQPVAASKYSYVLESHTNAPAATGSYFTATNIALFGIVITGGYIALRAFYNSSEKIGNLQKGLDKVQEDTDQLLQDTKELKRLAQEASEKLDEHRAALAKIEKKVTKGFDHTEQELARVTIELEGIRAEQKKNFEALGRDVSVLLQLKEEYFIPLRTSIGNLDQRLEAGFKKNEELYTMLAKRMSNVESSIEELNRSVQAVGAGMEKMAGHMDSAVKLLRWPRDTPQEIDFNKLQIGWQQRRGNN